MANEKGPNLKKKQKCKNCEGKGLLKKGRQGRQMPALRRDRGAVISLSWPPLRGAAGWR
jgi:hypothetical protein